MRTGRSDSNVTSCELQRNRRGCRLVGVCDPAIFWGRMSRMPQSPAHLSPAQRARQERRRMMLGETVGALRRERGMTQAQLAEAVGVSTRGVIRIEQGQTSLTVDVLWRVADALGMRVSALMRMAEDREAGEG